MRELYHKLKSEFKSYQTLLFVCFIFFMGAGFAFVATRNTDKSSAISTDGFNPGNIISDAVMANYNSMTVEEIQKFLTNKNPCNNRNYNLYKEQSTLYPKISWHWDGDEKSGHFVCISEEKFGEGTEIGEGETAAEIIYAAAQEYKINPQVLIVLLEKEQGLISDTYPHSNQYRSATGYGCPDTAACDSKYYGFKNQVFRAAELFRYTLDNGSYLYPDNKKGVYVAYNPSSSCGGTEVFIENRATSALYRYTPYQPNSAALAAGFGLGDTCSAYGNRNFYLYFTKWFGSTQAKVDGIVTIIPDGEYTLVSQTSTERVLGVVNQNVELAALTDDNTQRWNILRDTSTGYYTITNVATGEYLSIANAEVELRENLLTQKSAPDCTKLWQIYRTKDNYLTFESACMAGMVVDVDEASNRIGTNIQLWIANGCLAQKWKLRPGHTIEPGIYTITTKNDSGKNIDIAGGNSSNGTNVQLWQTNGEWPQDWQLTYDNMTGLYTFTNPASKKLLDLSAANTTIGTNIQIWQNTSACAQKWKIVKTPDNHYTFISSCAEDRAIDLAGGKTVNQNNIRLWETNNADAQKWDLHLIQPIANGTYTITAKNNSRQNVDVSGGVDANGTNIQLWQTNGEWPQDWIFKYDATTKSYTITNVGNGRRLLSVEDSNMNIGANVVLWENTQSCGQRWIIKPTSDGYYNFLSACDETRALDLADGLAVNQNNIRLWEVNGADAEKWQINRK